MTRFYVLPAVLVLAVVLTVVMVLLLVGPVSEPVAGHNWAGATWN